MDDIDLYLNSISQTEAAGDEIDNYLSTIRQDSLDRYTDLPEDDIDYFLGNPVTDFAAGAVETGLNLATSIPMGIAGGVESLADYAGGASAGEARETLGSWFEKAYQPRSEAGQAAIGTLGEGVEYVGQKIEDVAGEDARFLAEAGLALAPVASLKAFRGMGGRAMAKKLAKETGKDETTVVKDVMTGMERAVKEEANESPIQRNIRLKQEREMMVNEEIGVPKERFTKKGLDAILNSPNRLRLAGLPEIAAGIERMYAKAFQPIGEWSNRFLDRMTELEKRLVEKSPEDAAKWKSATLMEDQKMIKALWKKHFPEDMKVISEFEKMRAEFAVRMMKLDPKWEGIEGWWARHINDWDGLIEAMKRDPRFKGNLEKAELVQRKVKAGEMTPAEAGVEITKILKSGGRGKVTPMKSSINYERMFDKVPPKYHQYYSMPSEAIAKYLHETSRALAEQEFLGRRKLTGESMADLVGEWIAKREEGMSSGQLQTVQDILGSLFGPETYKSPPKWIQNLKTTSYGVTIVDFYSALTQISDLFGNVGDYGFRAAMRGAMNRPMRATRSGIRDIQHEMAEHSTGWTGKAQGMLDKGLQMSLFKKFDFFGKDARLSAAYYRYTDMAQKKPNKLYLKYRKMGFNDKLAQQYVKAWKKGDLSDPILVEAALMDLMRRQPLSPAQQAVWFNEHPSGRLLYVLKTWSIQQLNGVITDILSGNKGNAAKYSASLALGIVSIDLLKLMLDKALSGEKLKEEEVSQKTIDALLKAANPLFSRYEAQALWGQGPETAIGKMTAPPVVTSMWDVIMAVVGRKDPEKLIRHVPVVGDTAEELMKR